jgi:hypothetical protein
MTAHPEVFRSLKRVMKQLRLKECQNLAEFLCDAENKSLYIVMARIIADLPNEDTQAAYNQVFNDLSLGQREADLLNQAAEHWAEEERRLRILLAEMVEKVGPTVVGLLAEFMSHPSFDEASQLLFRQFGDGEFLESAL